MPSSNLKIEIYYNDIKCLKYNLGLQMMLAKMLSLFQFYLLPSFSFFVSTFFFPLCTRSF